MKPRAIEFQGVIFGYLPGVPVLDGIDLSLGPGLTLLVGPNGSGKSTLLKLAAGVERPDAGTVAVNGHDLWREEVEARRDLAYLPEAPDLTPYASVLEVLRLVCRLREVEELRAADALAEAGLAGLGNRSLRLLSKGQRRRALLAAAWIGTPGTVLLDEPLDGMDRAMQARMLEWLNGLRQDGALVLVVSHDIESFATITDHVIGIAEGRVQVFDAVPREADRRRELLEALARG